MASTTNINVRVDSELKSEAENLFSDIGLTMSSAITLFLRAAVNSDGIPFSLKREPNAQTRAALAEYEKMRDDPSAYRRYASFDELMKEVLSDA